MRYALTNYGLRRLAELSHGTPHCADGLDQADVTLLLQLRRDLALDAADPATLRLTDLHLIAPVTADNEVIARRYRQNPLEHVKRVAFEFTSRCNLTCGHCYNAGVPPLTEAKPAALQRAADLLLGMGIRRFDFVGGEVTRFGDGWLDVARHIRGRDDEVIVALYTNGWWLGRGSFTAAGQRYPDDRAYLEALRRAGVSHVLFSLDGEGEEHDRSRGLPGLYDRIVAGLPRVRQAGIAPRLSLLWRGQSTAALRALMARLADQIYDLPAGTPDEDKATKLAADETNKINHCIDVSAGAGYPAGGLRLHEIAPEQLRCKAFFRPSPLLTIKASGELATCRVALAGEGYGNIHAQPLVEILNELQRAFVYRLHAEGRIGEYLRFVDPQVFHRPVVHPCTARAVVTMIARRVEEQGIEPGDAEGVLRVNREVAALLGEPIPGDAAPSASSDRT